MLKALLMGTAIIAVGAPPVAAATVTAVFDGSVESGTDETGEFGIPGQSLAGLEFSATFVFDTERGQRDATDLFDGVLGGLLVGIDNPLLSAEIVINDVAQSITGAFLTFVLAETGSLYQVLALDSDLDGPTEVERRLDLSLTNPDILGDIEVPFTLEGEAVESGAGFDFSEIAEDGTVLVSAFGTLDVDRLSVTVEDGPAPIPLPASGLLLGGVLVLAGVARRARPRLT